ncbi:exodeoxyribonuclease V subunit alpha [Alteromonas sp. ASW11-19]|uniref:RecBCD enzyme subunit RecD n=1 Tax=Alteromonas salexigens TaxID=2982530 RepID=A0ABT2VVE7_9ALTE|nr:exodeoxyribonuclease V subunit alpha [Alteromonas salexigens]MCU7555824.1 exodeoxyribonuclease V subunit alpha [Alteromonas salexigens]
MMSLQQVMNTTTGLEAIDYYVARALCEDAQLDEQGSRCWFTVLLALSYMQRQGHTCLTLSAVADSRQFFEDELKEGLSFPSLTRLEQVCTTALASMPEPVPLVFENGQLFSKRYWEFENEVATAISQRTALIPLTDQQLRDCQTIWPALFPVTRAEQQDWQQIAVASSLVQGFSVINGGPGTGKTYTVTRLLLALQAAHDGNLNIQLAAPTGKAAQRLTESITQSLAPLSASLPKDLIASIPTQASTLHRLLGLARFGTGARRDASKPLNTDVLIVDEASMVDLALMTRLVRALPPHARLYLVGDSDQLPAVESGNVLEAMIGDTHERQGASEPMQAHLATLCSHLPVLPVTEHQHWVHTLRASQRFKGVLAEVAQAIQQGSQEQVTAQVTLYEKATAGIWHEGVALTPLPDKPQTLHALALTSFQALMQSQSPAEALAALLRCRWLTPMRRGPYGVEGLNQLVEQALAQRYPVTPGGWYAGRPIMVVENSYAQQLFNGDVGVLWPDENGQLKAWFAADSGEKDAPLRCLSLSRLPRTETVFAMTVHKSQGSEFAHVVMLVPDAQSSAARALNNRALLYTGLTRAKQGCLLVADTPVLHEVIGRRYIRHSGLEAKLGGGMAASVPDE